MKYTKKRAEIIANSLKNLESKTEACRLADITPKTYYEWYRDIPDFKEMMDKAQLEGLELTKHQAISAIKNQFTKNWTSAAWWLERTCPEEYGRREQINQNMTIQQVQIKYIQPEELPTSDETINLPEGTITLKIDDKQNDT